MVDGPKKLLIIIGFLDGRAQAGNGDIRPQARNNLRPNARVCNMLVNIVGNSRNRRSNQNMGIEL